MNGLLELVYEDLENATKATQDHVDGLFDWDCLERVGIASEIDSVLHPYFHRLVAIQLEFWVRTRGNDVDAQHFSFVYQYPQLRSRTADLSDVTNREGIPSQIADNSWGGIENEVFVDVRKAVQYCEGILDCIPDRVPALRVRSMVWLEFLDDADVPVAGVPQRPLCHSQPIERAKNDRELGSLDVSAVVPEAGDLESEMVESRTSVVGEVTEDDSPVGRNWVQETDPEYVLLRGTRLVLAKDLIGVAVKPGLDVSIQRFRVSLCPVQLQPEPVQRVMG